MMSNLNGKREECCGLSPAWAEYSPSLGSGCRYLCPIAFDLTIGASLTSHVEGIQIYGRTEATGAMEHRIAGQVGNVDVNEDGLLDCIGLFLKKVGPSLTISATKNVVKNITPFRKYCEASIEAALGKLLRTDRSQYAIWVIEEISSMFCVVRVDHL
jgi:hypothetical protein